VNHSEQIIKPSSLL